MGHCSTHSFLQDEIMLGIRSHATLARVFPCFLVDIFSMAKVQSFVGALLLVRDRRVLHDPHEELLLDCCRTKTSHMFLT